jgi:hypothetical protein
LLSAAPDNAGVPVDAGVHLVEVSAVDNIPAVSAVVEFLLLLARFPDVVDVVLLLLFLLLLASFISYA